jgi:hypothetical protein
MDQGVALEAQPRHAEFAGAALLDGYVDDVEISFIVLAYLVRIGVGFLQEAVIDYDAPDLLWKLVLLVKACVDGA